MEENETTEKRTATIISNFNVRPFCQCMVIVNVPVSEAVDRVYNLDQAMLKKFGVTAATTGGASKNENTAAQQGTLFKGVVKGLPQENGDYVRVTIVIDGVDHQISKKTKYGGGVMLNMLRDGVDVEVTGDLEVSGGYQNIRRPKFIKPAI